MRYRHIISKGRVRKGNLELDPEDYLAILDNSALDYKPTNVRNWVLNQMEKDPYYDLGEPNSKFGYHHLLTWDKPILVNEPDDSSWTFMGAIVHDVTKQITIDYYEFDFEAEKAWFELQNDYEDFDEYADEQEVEEEEVVEEW